MILLDTSVLVDFLRTKDSSLFARFAALNAAICGITRAEILWGARDSAHHVSLDKALGAFNQVAIPDTLWDSVGETLSRLRRSGLTVPFTDAVIATVAVSSGLELWTRDKQFGLIRQVIPNLVLFDESTP